MGTAPGAMLQASLWKYMSALKSHVGRTVVISGVGEVFALLFLKKTQTKPNRNKTKLFSLDSLHNVGNG